ncbi:hypothetical protein [Bosea sp. 124]|uniref:hypothetical protein n=1 Tax=Bosea sp. 124 TaxID=2135642 RepID=UPI0020BEE43F|nr:hypothetical protein [Bosea sp. 124]
MGQSIIPEIEFRETSARLLRGLEDEFAPFGTPLQFKAHGKTDRALKRQTILFGEFADIAIDLRIPDEDSHDQLHDIRIDIMG